MIRRDGGRALQYNVDRLRAREQITEASWPTRPILRTSSSLLALAAVDIITELVVPATSS